MENLKKIIQEAIYNVLSEASWNYHYGKNHSMKPYGSDNKFNMLGRSTGHFGSGTYFSTYKEKNLETKYQNNTTPTFIQIDDGIYRVDINIYENLYRVNSNLEGKILYTLLSYVNKMYNLLSYNQTDNLNLYYQIIRKNSNTLGLNVPPYREFINMMKNHNGIQSFSTVFMEYNGYNGVNVSDIPLFDNTTHGSVIYDISKLKNNITPISKKNKKSLLYTNRNNYYDNTITADDFNDIETMSLSGDDNIKLYLSQLNNMPLNQAMRILKNYTSSSNKTIPLFNLLNLNQNIIEKYVYLIYTKSKTNDSIKSYLDDYFYYKNEKYLCKLTEYANVDFLYDYIPDSENTLLIILTNNYESKLYYQYNDITTIKNKLKDYVMYNKQKINRKLIKPEIELIQNL